MTVRERFEDTKLLSYVGWQRCSSDRHRGWLITDRAASRLDRDQGDRRRAPYDRPWRADADAAFRSVAGRRGSVEITYIRRQRQAWQRRATRQLATGRTAEAVAACEQAGHVHAAESRDTARGDLIERRERDRRDQPAAGHIILTHTTDEVQANWREHRRLSS